jgi:hypothetical protein
VLWISDRGLISIKGWHKQHIHWNQESGFQRNLPENNKPHLKIDWKQLQVTLSVFSFGQ